MRQLVSVKRILLSDLPCLYTERTDTDECSGYVILYHGWSSKKENRAFLATVLSQYGYRVILPDAIHHGERGSLDYSDPSVFMDYSWRCVKQNIEESTPLIEAACDLFKTQPSRFALIGESMGGFSAAGAFVRNPDLNSLVCVNGSCAYEKAFEINLTKNAPNPSAEALGLIRAVDPMSHKELLRERPILILHGDSDTTVPLASQQYFMEEIAPLYQKHPERLQMIVSNHCNHHFVIAMVEQAVLWLDRFLKID